MNLAIFEGKTKDQVKEYLKYSGYPEEIDPKEIPEQFRGSDFKVHSHRLSFRFENERCVEVRMWPR